ncbi:hypothetical protein B0T18DRAFT_413129 [Schizothecium vesticola]|uniref:Uncharacterized protein n=1 Tax=Schizothecium vesticola TaxID=314040 RepID=A0AA40EXD3_9PEZI|nr:hypothetical protein B0T18DRAFT_413129 [Schizothecium vesticola]
MQLSSSLAALAAIAGLANAGTITPRALVTSFTLSTGDGCAVNPSFIDVPFGQACGTCTRVPTYDIPGNTSGNPSVPAKSVSVTFKNARCRVRFYQDHNCADPGIESGTAGCWNPEGLVRAYKVDCPAYPETENPKPCSVGAPST